ncbi:DNA invertase Pin-like site-specific DNA recombinase [Arthrobacter sp. CG_A4]|nr:DNA invertase Pin-like site-specific DNA recombinase [Arthrobacter sp. CG_A4]
MLTTLAAFAKLVRDTKIEHTGAGLATAAANNGHGGRPRKIDSCGCSGQERNRQGISASDIGKMLGVSRATVCRYLP